MVRHENLEWQPRHVGSSTHWDYGDETRGFVISLGGVQGSLPGLTPDSLLFQPHKALSNATLPTFRVGDEGIRFGMSVSGRLGGMRGEGRLISGFRVDQRLPGATIAESSLRQHISLSRALPGLSLFSGHLRQDQPFNVDGSLPSFRGEAQMGMAFNERLPVFRFQGSLRRESGPFALREPSVLSSFIADELSIKKDLAVDGRLPAPLGTASLNRTSFDLSVDGILPAVMREGISIARYSAWAVEGSAPALRGGNAHLGLTTFGEVDASLPGVTTNPLGNSLNANANAFCGYSMRYERQL